MRGAAIADDRRRYRRHSSSANCRLTVDGLPGELIDWSFSGLGIRIDVDDITRFAINTEVDVAVLCRRSQSWERLCGRIQRIDAANRVLGIEIDDDGGGSVRILIELFTVREAVT